MKNSNQQLVGSYNASVTPLGGGGFITGMDIAPDGSVMVHNTDTYGGFIRYPASGKPWEQIVLAQKIPSAFYDPTWEDNSAVYTRLAGASYPSQFGTWQTRIAPSDPDVIYFGLNGRLFRSADGGATFSMTNSPAKCQLGNTGQNRIFNRCIDIHPTDPDTVVYGTSADGVFYSTDGFATETEINVPEAISLQHDIVSASWASGVSQGTISAATWAGNTLTLTTSAAHTMVIGQQIVVSGVTPSTYNGTYTVTGVPSSTSVTVANVTTNPGSYSSGGSIASNIVTIETARDHHFVVDTFSGDGIYTFDIAGAAPSAWNKSSLVVTEIVNSTTFKACFKANSDPGTYTSGGYVRHSNMMGFGLGKYLVAFDPNTPTTIYIHVFGYGVYRSTTGLGADSFSLLSGGPKYASCLVVDQVGNVYVVEHRFLNADTTTGDSLWKWNGAWSNIADTYYFLNVAVDPNDADIIVACNENGGFFQTTDGGTTWWSHSAVRGDGEVDWLSNNNKQSFPSQLLFDPVVPNKVWRTDGVSHCYSTRPTSNGQQWVWHDYSAGNEELLIQTGFTRPGVEPPILVGWDKPVWRINYINRYKNEWTYCYADGSYNQNGVYHSLSIDYAGDDLNTIVVAQANGGGFGISRDGGTRFRPFPSPLPAGFGYGGAVAVNTANNFVLIGGNNGNCYYTKDGGTTWLPVTLGAYSPVNNVHPFYALRRQCVAADKTRPGTFALVVYNSPVGRDIAGLWFTSDGGDSWTQNYSGCFMAAGESQVMYYDTTLRYNPYVSQELWFCDNSSDNGSRLYRSTNDGVSWTQPNTNITKVYDFDFGKPPPGSSVPTMFIAGAVNGVYGLYISFDLCATNPTLMTSRPFGFLSRFTGVVGDKNKFGRCFVGVRGSGAITLTYGKQITLT